MNIHALAELFVVGTFWFWVLVAAEILLVGVFVTYENGLAATISIFAFLGLLQFCGSVDIFSAILHHPLLVAGGAVAWLLCGTVWAVIKWWIFVHDQNAEYEEYKSEWLRSQGLPSTKVVPPEVREKWADYVANNYDLRRVKAIPLAKDNKSRIIHWMALWLPSMVCFFVNDLLKRVFRAIYYRIADFLQRMADRIYANVQQDFEGVTGKKPEAKVTEEKNANRW